MDKLNDINLLSLQYLTNKYVSKKNIDTNGLKKNKTTDINFYKKRIMNETKNMLKKQYASDHLKYIFNSYISVLIDYFKAIDTRDIIQETYIDTDNTNTTIPIDTNIDIDANTDIILDPNATINMQNERLFNTGDNKNKIITLDNFVISKKPKYVINYPIVKDVNLKDISLKIKGIAIKE
jgi:hypothetical protein